METKPISVLIIEDDQFVRMFLNDMFMLHGHEYNCNILIASNATQAEVMIKNNTPEIIFLDLGLPLVEGGPVDANAGFPILEHIRHEERTKNIPVIVFSGYSDSEIKERALKTGANEFLVKGEYMPKDIITIVKKYCSTGACVMNPAPVQETS